MQDLGASRRDLSKATSRVSPRGACRDRTIGSGDKQGSALQAVVDAKKRQITEHAIFGGRGGKIIWSWVIRGPLYFQHPPSRVSVALFRCKLHTV